MIETELTTLLAMGGSRRTSSVEMVLLFRLILPYAPFSFVQSRDEQVKKIDFSFEGSIEENFQSCTLPSFRSHTPLHDSA